MCLKSLLLKKRLEFFEYVILIILLFVWSYRNEKIKFRYIKFEVKYLYEIVINKVVLIVYKYLNLLDVLDGFNYYSIWLK